MRRHPMSRAREGPRSCAHSPRAHTCRKIHRLGPHALAGAHSLRDRRRPFNGPLPLVYLQHPSLDPPRTAAMAIRRCHDTQQQHKQQQHMLLPAHPPTGCHSLYCPSNRHIGGQTAGLVLARTPLQARSESSREGSTPFGATEALIPEVLL